VGAALQGNTPPSAPNRAQVMQGDNIHAGLEGNGRAVNVLGLA